MTGAANAASWKGKRDQFTCNCPPLPRPPLNDVLPDVDLGALRREAAREVRAMIAEVA